MSDQSHEVSGVPLLEVEHLTMRFGGLVAIGDLSFTAMREQITALIGPNGAGKTTVFNCLTGFYKPTEGRLTLHHPVKQEQYYLEQMDGFRIPQVAGVARTFQNIRLFGNMTVLENLLVAQHNKLMVESGFSVFGLLGLKKYRKAEAEAIELAKYWLDRVGLYDKADWNSANLPYGDQRRLEIARAMCTRPQALCLDEPAAGLNPKETLEMNELFHFIKEEEKIGLLLIEHDMSMVMEVSDHVVVIDYGRKISDGTPDHVKNDPAVIRAYLGEEEDEELPPEVAQDFEGENA
ncbi:ABC transporter ATP-binding protein [Terasakiella pusilla]|uniref:ABC transporter ATP-binding protein n=1 Tax=Terasakiella pusilla TaxID=64973 RepID=UPI003AA81043